VREVIETPFHPRAVGVRPAGGRVVSVGAAVRCPAAPGTAMCASLPGGRRRAVIAGAGSTLTIIARSLASAVRLRFGRHSLRARAVSGGSRRWQIRLPRALSSGVAGTLLVSFPLGTAQYRLRLAATRRR
jgi:hypothetical protein